MNHKSKLIVAIIWMIVLCFVFGCANPYLDDTSSKTTLDILPENTPEIIINNPADAVGNITFGIYGFDTLNPLVTKNKAIQKYMTLVYDSLVVYDLECKPKASVANKWSTNDGGLTWNIKIKDNILFHDGAKLTVYDIKNTLDWLKVNESSFSHCADGVDSYEVISQFEINIKLESPDGMFPYKLNFPILKSEDLNSFNVPNGTGKYKYISSSEGSFIFEINDLYFANSCKIKNFTIMCYENAEALYKSNVDVILNYNDNVIKYSKKDGYAVGQYKDNTVCCMVASDKLNIETKQYINSILDKEQIINAAMAGYACETNTVFAEDAYFMKDYVLNDYNIGAVKLDYLNIIVCKTDEDLIRISNIVKKQIEAKDIKCEVSVLDNNDFYEALSLNNYDLAFMNYEIMTVPDVENIFTIDGSMNYNKFHDDSVNNLIASLKDSYSEIAISSVIDDESFFEYCNGQTVKLASRLDDVLPLICICRKNATVLLSDNVTGVNLYNFNFWNTIDFNSWEMRADNDKN